MVVHYARAALAVAAVATGIGFASATGESASPQSGVRCAGHYRCLQRGAACRARLNASYHRFLFHCDAGFLVYSWTGLVRRPLHIPILTAGSTCPATEVNGTLREHGSADGGPAFGPGPAYPTLYDNSGQAQLNALLAFGYEGWAGTKVLWTIPRYYGPYIVRGRRLDGPNALKFDQGPSWTRRLHDELRLVGPYSGLNPAATYLQAPGCYAYQVDGRGFSYLIVMEAVIVSPS